MLLLVVKGGDVVVGGELVVKVSVMRSQCCSRHRCRVHSVAALLLLLLLQLLYVTPSISVIICLHRLVAIDESPLRILTFLWH